MIRSHYPNQKHRAEVYQIQDFEDILFCLPKDLLKLIGIYLNIIPKQKRKHCVWLRQETERQEQWKKNPEIKINAKDLIEVGKQLRKLYGDEEPDWSSLIQPCFSDILQNVERSLNQIYRTEWFYDASEEGVSSPEVLEEVKEEVKSSFDTRTSYFLTKVFERDPTNTGLQIQESFHTRRINLATMIQTNVSTGRQRKIWKNLNRIKSLDFPPIAPYLRERSEHQTFQKDLGYPSHVSHRGEDPEMVAVRNFFSSQMSEIKSKGSTLSTSISRIHNVKSFNMFRAQLDSFQNKNVVLVWHACHQTKPELLVRNGLTVTFNSPRNRWGTGHYFSSKAIVSHGYTNPASNTKTLFLALVALGEVYVATTGDDYKISQGPFTIGDEFCDSVMGPDLYCPTATNFCIPRDSQAFLLYRLDYTWFPMLG